MPSTIERIAILYGDSRYGRSCASCNYSKRKIMTLMCELHCLPTEANKVCGTWCGEKVKAEEVKQGELF